MKKHGEVKETPGGRPEDAKEMKPSNDSTTRDHHNAAHRRVQSKKNPPKKGKGVKKKQQTNIGPPAQPVSQIAMDDLNLEEHVFEDQKPKKLDPKGVEQALTLDVTALDRYNEDIQHYRNIIVNDCRQIIKLGAIRDSQCQRLSTAISSLCRGAYYGTYRSQVLAAEAIPMLVWILNKPELPPKLHLTVLTGLGELLYDSLLLKKQFVEQNGVKILFHLMRHLPAHPTLALLATYILAMASVACPDMILDARKQTDSEEIVSELTFEYYWIDWPVNYGFLLQGILFGPNALSPNQELFQFV